VRLGTRLFRLEICGAAVLMVIVTSCSSSGRDALIVNPCRDDALVALSSDPEASARFDSLRDRWGEEHRVSPYSSVQVDDAFVEDGGSAPYSARIRFVTAGSVEGLSVGRRDTEPLPVIIPADSCPHLQRP
jgi:hypothetical protein